MWLETNKQKKPWQNKDTKYPNLVFNIILQNKISGILGEMTNSSTKQDINKLSLEYIYKWVKYTHSHMHTNTPTMMRACQKDTEPTEDSQLPMLGLFEQ